MSEWAEQRSIPVPESGCWIWLGAEKGNGYGNVRYRKTNQPAHRRSYIEAFGPIPTGLHVCHRCDTRLCVNPDHLFLGTRQQNMQDCVKKDRQAKGASLPQTKLAPETVRLARRLRKQGLRFTDIASRVGVERSTVASAIKGHTWRHV